jgi:CBS domain-containing protein
VRKVQKAFDLVGSYGQVGSRVAVRQSRGLADGRAGGAGLRTAEEKADPSSHPERIKIADPITERDYARKIVLMARSSKETAVRDIMTTSVMYVLPAHTSEECMALMTEHRLRHLPVIDNGKLVGLISIGDLVKDIIAEQKFIIQQLGHYITGELG